MAEIRRTFIPQFTVRRILALTAAMAVVSFIAARTGQVAWAGGITVGLAALAVTFAVYAAMFVLATVLGRWLQKMRSRRDGNRKAGEDQNSLVAVKSLDSTTGGGSSAAKVLLFALMTVLCGLSATTSEGASGGTWTVPQLQPGEVNNTGLTLTLDTVWVDSGGYRPVRIAVKSLTGPVAADRVLTLTFRPMQNYTQLNSVAVTQTIEIPAGASSAEATMSVPQICTWGMFTLDVFEDGETVKQLSIPESVSWISSGATTKGDSASPVTLLLSGMDKVSGSLLVNQSMELLCVVPDDVNATIDPQITSAAGSSAQQAQNTSSPALASAIPSFSQLSKRWIDYTGFDVMVISLEKWKVLHEQNSAQWQAINGWLHNGGTLIVYDTGKRWGNIAEVERLTLGDVPTANTESSDDLTKRGWNLPKKYLRDQAFNSIDSQAVSTRNLDEVAPLDQAPFVTRPCGLGLLVAIPSDEPIGSRSNPYPWPWLFNTMGPQRWQWSQRWGVSLHQANNDFWNFLIPGVGLVPVFQFQVLITLFVVALGPINYYLLRHWGKLNLTVLTVPIGALLVTGGLLVYALVEDGLSVRVRALSYTHLNQRSNEASCWTRLSYYAGLAPSGGLKFSEDTAAIPMDAQTLADGQQPSRTVEWERTVATDANSPLEQRLSSGWLYSRTPTQFITARIRHGSEQLEIQPGNNGAPPAIVNRLGTTIRQLLVVDTDGKCYTAAQVATEAKENLQAAESQSSVFLNQLQTAMNVERTMFVDPSNQGNVSLFGFDRDRRYGQRTGTNGRLMVRYVPQDNAQTFSANGGILERSLSEVRNKLLSDSLPPRTYVAVVDQSPEVELGTASARPEESAHVIMGEW
jgi:hypothetical protein